MLGISPSGLRVKPPPTIFVMCDHYNSGAVLDYIS